MKLLLAACLAAACGAALAANPFEGFKGKVKEGLYEYKTEMDMAGMPAGVRGQPQITRNCITAEDIGGGFNKDNKMPENCQVKNFNMAGNTASYTLECQGEMAMKSDNRITFSGDSFKMDMKVAMNQGGQVLNMTQRMQARYIGPCNKK